MGKLWTLAINGLIVLDELMKRTPEDQERLIADLGRGRSGREQRPSEHTPPWPKGRPLDFRAPAPEAPAPETFNRDTSDLTGWPWQPGKIFKTWEEKQSFLDDMLKRGEEIRREEARAHGRDPYSPTPSPWKLPEIPEEGPEEDGPEEGPEDPPVAPCPWDPAE